MKKLYNLENKKILVAGHTGMVGKALMKELEKVNCQIFGLSKNNVDFRNQEDTHYQIKEISPDAVFLLAAKVGGIIANNKYPAEFLYDNLSISKNIIHSCYLNNVEKLMFFGSACVYPKYAPIPIKEDYLLSGELEPTNQWYAIAKISGIKMCESYKNQYGCNFISVMPTNLYGVNDNFNETTGHVIPSLIKKFYFAKKNNLLSVKLLGTGIAKREFLNVKDFVSACVVIMENYSETEPINVGMGEYISIFELANLIKKIIKYEGEIEFDNISPDGTPERYLDSSKLDSMKWRPKISLEDGIKEMFYHHLNELNKDFYSEGKIHDISNNI